MDTNILSLSVHGYICMQFYMNNKHTTVATQSEQKFAISICIWMSFYRLIILLDGCWIRIWSTSVRYLCGMRLTLNYRTIEWFASMEVLYDITYYCKTMEIYLSLLNNEKGTLLIPIFFQIWYLLLYENRYTGFSCFFLRQTKHFSNRILYSFFYLFYRNSVHQLNRSGHVSRRVFYYVSICE